MVASKLRFILGLELVSYFFAAPYIILLGLDDKRGLLIDTISMNNRLWAYTLLIGIYPFLLMLVSPSVGRQLDQKKSKISILRKIHLANSICYALLALSSWLHSYPLAIFAFCIPGVVGCASPVGKSLIANLTKQEERVIEFAKIAFIKGAAKLFIPLAGAFIFKFFFNEISYAPMFIFSSFLSFSCFAYTFTFPHFDTSHYTSPANCNSIPTTPMISLIAMHFRKNSPLLLTFGLLITAYSIFLKFTPFILFEKLGNNPSIVNYFASIVGLAYVLNQFILVKYSNHVRNFIGAIFMLLCSLLIAFCFTVPSYLWLLPFFGVQFCFCILNTCVEAHLSMKGISANQGTVQGLLYSIENWGYVAAPIIGSLMSTFSSITPLYLVTFLALISSGLFFYSQLLQTSSQRDGPSEVI